MSEIDKILKKMWRIEIGPVIAINVKPSTSAIRTSLIKNIHFKYKLLSS